MGWNSGHRGGRCSVILGGLSWPLPVPPAVVNGPSTKWKVRFHSWKSSSHRTWPPAKACWQSTATSYWGWPTVGLRTCRNPQASVGVLRHENTPHVPENIAATNAFQATLALLDGNWECTTFSLEPFLQLPGQLAAPCSVPSLNLCRYLWVSLWKGPGPHASWHSRRQPQRQLADDCWMSD